MRCEELSIHSVFKQKQRSYFQQFALSHLGEMRRLKSHHLFYTEEGDDFREVVRHQLLVATLAKELCELLQLPQEDTVEVESKSLTHDEDKYEQVRGKSRDEALKHELQKESGLARATSTHFGDFDTWGIKEYILRFCDSSATTVLLPWRERVAKLYETKADENLLGYEIYGVGMWDKLNSIMEEVEVNLYKRIVSLNPELVKKYPSSSHLNQMVEDKLIDRVMKS